MYACADLCSIQIHEFLKRGPRSLETTAVSSSLRPSDSGSELMAYHQFVEPGDLQSASSSPKSSSTVTNRVVGGQYHICRRFEPEA